MRGMPRPWRIRFAGAKYHVMSRGNGRAAVFLEPADYERFLKQLDQALEADQVVLYSYILMPNHYHLLIETPRGNLSRFMQRLNTAYSLYFRHKKQRPGHCFQGRFRARLVEGDEYLVRLTRYHHLNPVKVREYAASGIEEKKAALERWRWSSYRGYAGLGPREERVNYRWLALMGCRTVTRNQEAYRLYVESMLGVDDEVLLESWRRSRYALGDEAFQEEAEQSLYDQMQDVIFASDVIPSQRKAPSLEDIEQTVMTEYGVSREVLYERCRRSLEAKAMVFELCCQMTDVTQRALAIRFGYKHESAIGKQRRLLSVRMATDPALARRYEAMEKGLRAIF